MPIGDCFIELRYGFSFSEHSFLSCKVLAAQRLKSLICNSKVQWIVSYMFKFKFKKTTGILYHSGFQDLEWSSDS